MFVVTKNYRDPNSRERWLIRHQSQEPKDAVACAGVIAIGVTFAPALVERRHGCMTAAYCYQARSIDTTPDSDLTKATRLHYDNGGWFVDEKTGIHIPACDKLHLHPDRKAYAFFEPAPTAHAAEERTLETT